MPAFIEPDECPPKFSSTEENEGQMDQPYVFEGPEKKLEIFFSSGPVAEGFRHFQAESWSWVLQDASCSILHHEGNDHFDAYILSESSLFVYPSRVILKTCGTTTLLLVIPKLLELASKLGAHVEHVQYGHYCYKFPEQQLLPHSSPDEESEYLGRYFSSVNQRTIGPADGYHWVVICAGHPIMNDVSPPRPSTIDDIFEVAMEGLHADVCQIFSMNSCLDLHSEGRSKYMSDSSGISALLKGVEIDDWAFEPCGYSMNGLRGENYYTIHVTPEAEFSYASFETNDPCFRTEECLNQLVEIFKPHTLTATLTTRRSACQLSDFKLQSYRCLMSQTAQLSDSDSVSCLSFVNASMDVGLTHEDSAHKNTSASLSSSLNPSPKASPNLGPHNSPHHAGSKVTFLPCLEPGSTFVSAFA